MEISWGFFLEVFFSDDPVGYRPVGAAVKCREWSVMQITALWSYTCSYGISVKKNTGKKRNQLHSESFSEISDMCFRELGHKLR